MTSFICILILIDRFEITSIIYSLEVNNYTLVRDEIHFILKHTTSGHKIGLLEFDEMKMANIQFFKANITISYCTEKQINKGIERWTVALDMLYIYCLACFTCNCTVCLETSRLRKQHSVIKLTPWELFKLKAFLKAITC